MLRDEEEKKYVMVELAVNIDAVTTFVKVTYNLEGDSPLSPPYMMQQVAYNLLHATCCMQHLVLIKLMVARILALCVIAAIITLK